MICKEEGPMNRKLFIFDVGGVIVLHAPTIEEFCQRYQLDPRSVNSDWRAYIKPMLDGFLPVTQFYKALEAKYGIDLSNDNIMLTCYHPATNHGMKKIVAMLRENGHRVVTGSNTFNVHWDYLKSLDPSPLSGFDHLYASHEMHLSKPDVQFYQYIMKAEGFEPQDSFMIDDFEINLQAPRSIGMECFCYHDNDQELLTLLKEKGYIG